MDISSRACAFIRRYLRAFQFSAKPPLSLVHRSIISSRGTCRLCSMLHLDVDRVPPISHIPSTAANELPSVIGDATFLQIFCHSIPRRLSLNCRTGDAKRSANFGRFIASASLLHPYKSSVIFRASPDRFHSARMFRDTIVFIRKTRELI